MATMNPKTDPAGIKLKFMPKYREFS